MQVTGDSIYNLLALADVETDKDDRPVYTHKILSVEVAFSFPSSFDDLPFLFWYLFGATRLLIVLLLLVKPN